MWASLFFGAAAAVFTFAGMVTGVDACDSGLVLEGAGDRKATIDLSYVGKGRQIRECVLGYVPVESLRRPPTTR